MYLSEQENRFYNQFTSLGNPFRTARRDHFNQMNHELEFYFDEKLVPKKLDEDDEFNEETPESVFPVLDRCDEELESVNVGSDEPTTTINLTQEMNIDAEEIEEPSIEYVNQAMSQSEKFMSR